MFRDQVIKIVKGRGESLPREGVRKPMKSLDMEFENENNHQKLTEFGIQVGLGYGF